MPAEKIQIDAFIEKGKKLPVLDVRSPAEYNHAHVPGALNLPLFSNEERKLVGTAYKQQSREAAIRLGLDFFGPKMRLIVEEVERIVQSVPGHSRQVLLHCWRGGMRSEAVAWLLDIYGFKVYTLSGGYKAYRHWVITSFSYPFPLNVLGGFTGSGKTFVLKELRNRGATIIDLENLASHKGSAFGNIGMPPQPSQEMFENLLGEELRKIIGKHESGQQQPVWIEDESQRIGPVNIPHGFWLRMQQSTLFFVDIPFEERLRHLVDEYGSLDRERMASAILRIKKRLGGLDTNLALEFLADGAIESCFRILLKYYDKLYRKAVDKKDAGVKKIHFNCADVNTLLNTEPFTNKELTFQ